MRGLLYKEFYLGRKTYLAFFALTLLFTILGILVCVSMICGNLQEAAKNYDQKAYYAMVFTYVPYLLFLCSVAGSNQSIYKDYESKWMTYSYTLPTDAKLAVGARYLAGVLILAGGFLYGLVNAGIISMLTDISITTDVLKNMVVIMLMACVLYAFVVPLAMKYKTANAVTTRVIIVFVLLYLAFFIVVLWVERKGDEAANAFYEAMSRMSTFTVPRDWLFSFSPLLIPLVLAASCYISMRIYRRREK